jgi:hypothetical protein
MTLRRPLRCVRRVLGFAVLAEFKDQRGFDGVIVGHPKQPHHIEFTSQRGHHVGKAATRSWSPAPPNLFRGTRIGVRFDVATLLVHDAAQLTLHRLERVVNHLVERLVRAIVHLRFITDELMASRHGHIDATPEWIPFLMGVVGLLDGHIAAVDMIAKFLQSRRVIQNEVVDLV